MNVLVLCHEIPPVGGGAASVCRSLAGELAASGWSVTALTMGWRDLQPRERTSLGVTVVRLPCGRRHQDWASGAEALRWARRAFRWAEQRHAEVPFDVVHAHFVIPGGLVAARLLGSRRTRLPFVLTAHGTDVPGYNPHRFRLAHRLIRPLWRRICRTAHRLISPSHSLRALIQAASPDVDPHVIPNPVDTCRFTPGVKQRRILLCSRLVARKGIAGLFAALRGIDLPGWEIDVVGDGPEFVSLRRIAAELPLAVHFHGWLDQDDPRLADSFARAEIFAFPSPWENLPVALLEAMAAGCAIVCADAAGNLEAVGQAARTVPASDGAAFARALRELAGDEASRRRLGRDARRRAEALFSTTTIAAHYREQLVEAVLAARPR
jgi:glycosyltransferase involved in cell wall biosynthesis